MTTRDLEVLFNNSIPTAPASSKTILGTSGVNCIGSGTTAEQWRIPPPLTLRTQLTALFQTDGLVTQFAASSSLD